MKTILALVAIMSAAVAANAGLPSDIAGQLPPGYEGIGSAQIAVGKPVRSFEIVALRSKNEGQFRQNSRPAAARPLLIFGQKDGRLALVGRNDHVILKADEGGQCDPFLDGDAKIVAKGRYFTIENGVACGEHWTDYITFRLDLGKGEFVFDNQRQEEWEFNRSKDPDAEALVPAGPPRVVRDSSGHVTPFVSWRPKG